MEELLGAVGLSLGATLGYGIVRTVGAVLRVVPTRRSPRPTAFRYTSRDGRRYYLHRRMLAQSSGRPRHLLYFAPDLRPGEEVARLPAGYDIIENDRTGMPLLKRAATTSPSGGSHVPAGATRGGRVAPRG